MFYLIIAGVIAFGGAMAWGKIEQTRANHLATEVSTLEQTVKDREGQIADRDLRIVSANNETQAANNKLVELGRLTKQAQDAAAAFRIKNAQARAASAARETDLLSRPKATPENSCAAACTELSQPL
jgi:chromosome segregation ATPase